MIGKCSSDISHTPGTFRIFPKQTGPAAFRDLLPKSRIVDNLPGVQEVERTAGIVCDTANIPYSSPSKPSVSWGHLVLKDSSGEEFPDKREGIFKLMRRNFQINRKEFSG